MALRLHIDKKRLLGHKPPKSDGLSLIKTKILISDVMHNLIFFKTGLIGIDAIEPNNLMALSEAQKCPLAGEFLLSLCRHHIHLNAVKMESE